MRRFLFAVGAVFVIIELAVLVNGCAPKPFTVYLPHPTPEQISALAAPTKPRPTAIRPERFELVLMPPVTVSGGSVWVTCYAPINSLGVRALAIRWGIEGIRTSEGPLESSQNRLLVERVPCGAWLATCALSNGRRIEAKLEALGGDCDVQAMQVPARSDAIQRDLTGLIQPETLEKQRLLR